MAVRQRSSLSQRTFFRAGRARSTRQAFRERNASHRHPGREPNTKDLNRAFALPFCTRRMFDHGDGKSEPQGATLELLATIVRHSRTNMNASGAGYPQLSPTVQKKQMILIHPFPALQIWATRTGYSRYTRDFSRLNCRRSAPWLEFPPCPSVSTPTSRSGCSSTGGVYCEAREFRVFAISRLRRRSSRSRFALPGNDIAAASTVFTEGIPPANRSELLP